MVHIVLEYLKSQVAEIKEALIEDYNSLCEKPDLELIVCDTIPMATAW